MNFAVPGSTVRFAIPDDWWDFCEMPHFRPTSEFYPYTRACTTAVAVPIGEIEPPRRDPGIPPFRKYKLVPVLLAFQSPQCALPPVPVQPVSSSPYRYRPIDGYHRFYASVAVGYPKLPVVL